MKTKINEIDEGTGYTGYREACDIIAANIHPAGVEELSLYLCAGRVAVDNLAARVSYPSQDVSLKDGFTVKSSDVVSATRDKAVRLKVSGSAYAGCGYPGRLENGNAVKICSGAPIPEGADAVVSGEFCEELSAGEVSVMADAGPGRNVLSAGIEVQAGALIVRRGEKLLPDRLGLAASSGISKINVYRRPRVAILSIGDEVVVPGEKLHIGQLYASNMVTMQAWLASYGISCAAAVVADKDGAINTALQKSLADADVILTSGGAWGSERDLIIGVLDKLCWKKLFHYVRMGPGKGVAFGILGNVPVFCLPGGPMSNRMAFLQLALPAILRMAGDNSQPLRIVQARLTEDVKGRHHAWTEFKDAVVTMDNNGNYTAAVYRNRSGLQAIAGAGGLICIPEGRESLNCGDIVPVQLLF